MNPSAEKKYEPDPGGTVLLVDEDSLGGHFKTGYRWAGQNRPMGGRPGLSCFTLPAPLLASRFWFASFAGRTSAGAHG
jgi:hypothetical protein